MPINKSWTAEGEVFEQNDISTGMSMAEAPAVYLSQLRPMAAFAALKIYLNATTSWRTAAL